MSKSNQQSQAQVNLELDVGGPVKDYKAGAYWQRDKRGEPNAIADSKNLIEPNNIEIRISGIPKLENVSVGPHWQIEELMSLIEKESGVKARFMDLYFGGEKLIADYVVSDCGIEEQSIITAVLHSIS